MSKNRFVSVWDAIEGTHEEAENTKLRSALVMALKAHLARTDLSQAQIAKLIGVTQPRVSDLMRGKIDLFDLDALVNMAAAAGLRARTLRSIRGEEIVIRAELGRRSNESHLRQIRGGNLGSERARQIAGSSQLRRTVGRLSAFQ